MREIAVALGVSADWLIFARAATLDRHCLAVAISSLDDIRSAALKSGAEMSLLSLAELLSDFYEEEYAKHQGIDED